MSQMQPVGDYDRLMAGCEPIPEAGCWLWTRSTTGDAGYGSFWFRGKNDLAHRASWALHRGEVPAGVNVCHKCDTQSCINPDHLFLGTQAENIADMHQKRRAFIPQGSKHGCHKLTENEVREIRARGRRGDSSYRIARDYPVSPRTIRGILSGQEWRHVL